MSKNVLTAIVLSDEAETFALIEPFYSTSSFIKNKKSYIKN